MQEKTYYSISEVSKMTEVKPYILRFWEKEFRQINPYKDPGGTRRYRKKDIDAICEVKQLLYEQKFTVKGAKEALQREKNGESVCVAGNESLVIDKIKRELNELKIYIDELKEER